MATKFAERTLILVKTEQTYNTDPIPTVSANAIISSVPVLEYDVKSVERQSGRTTFGQNDKLNIMEAAKITFSTEVKAGNNRTTAPRIAALLKACGLAETAGDAEAATAFLYKVSDSLTNVKSCTIYFYQDGILRKITGAVGTAKLVMEVNQLVEIQWTLWGFYHAATDATPGTPTFETNTPILFKSVTFGTEAELTGNKVDKLEIELGNEVKKVPSAESTNGVGEFTIVQRKITGTASREADAMSTFDPVERHLNRDLTNKTYTISLGDETTNLFEIDLDCVYLDEPKQANRDGILWWELPFSIQRAPYDTTTIELQLSFRGPAA